MKKYYIKAKKGFTGSLAELIRQHLSISEEETLSLISIGAVWNGDAKKRIRNPDQRITGELIVVHKPQFEVRPYPLDRSDIVLEEKGFLVVFKKPGYPTVPTPFSDINSLSFALEQFYQSEKTGIKINVINRLDTDAQGLVFFGKNKQAVAALHRMFRERKVRKWYLAGTAAFEKARTDYFLEDELEWHEKSKKAKTYIHLLRKSENRFCFLVRPYTGRTHQIRKHFASYLVPIRGDSVYGNCHRGKDCRGKDCRGETLELVCFAYIFPHPVTGKRMKVMYLPRMG